MTENAASLEARVQRCEDELAIRNLIARYGTAADCGDAAAAMACHSENAVYTVSAPESGRSDRNVRKEDLVMRGREAIGEMLVSELHQSLLPRCAHMVHSLIVTVDGDEAHAFAYSQILLKEPDEIKIMRVAINRWQLGRYGSRWLIDSRESRLLGEEAAQAVLRSI